MGKIVDSSELRCTKRAVLQDVIPLPAPFLLAIEPTNLCNLKCAFCPTSDRKLLEKVKRQNGIMSLELFKQVVDGARNFPEKIKEVCLFKDGEPLLNNQLCEMIAYLKQANICNTIKIFTNGLLLTPELNQRLIDSGADFIRISVEGVNAKKYSSLCDGQIDYAKFLSNIKDLFLRRGTCKVVAKIIDINLSDAEKQKFYDDFSPITDICAVEDVHGWTFSDQKDFSMGIKKNTFDGIVVKNKQVCPYPFYSIAVNCRGIVTIGCCDWALQTTIGDIHQESIYDIWNGKRLYDFRMMHLEHRKHENPACRVCSHMAINPDNIDGFETKIMAALKSPKQ